MTYIKKNDLSVQLLVATMYQQDYRLLDQLNIECNVIVVNQCFTNSEQLFKYNGYDVKWINTTERGLSKSRNKALNNASADICIIADDDEILVPGHIHVIKKAFSRRPKASIIGFQAQGIEQTFKNYSSKATKVGYLRSMKMASVEIAFKRKDITSSGILFDERIGSGSKYHMGEDNAFLFHCLAKGLKIYYSPELICRIHMTESTWFKGFNENYLICKGATFAAMSKSWSPLLILLFTIKHGKSFGKISTYQILKLMWHGRYDYLNDI